MKIIVALIVFVVLVAVAAQDVAQSGSIQPASNQSPGFFGGIGSGGSLLSDMLNRGQSSNGGSSNGPLSFFQNLFSSLQKFIQNLMNGMQTMMSNGFKRIEDLISSGGRQISGAANQAGRNSAGANLNLN